MRRLVFPAGVVVAVLAAAAPASSGPVPDRAATSERAAPDRAAPRPAPTPSVVPPGAGEPCVVPVGSSLSPCPDTGPPATCVLPVATLPEDMVTPDVCRVPRQPPEGRVVPVPATR